MIDSMTRLERIALGLSMASQALVVARWYMGSDVPAIVLLVLVWLSVVVAIAAGVALDMVVVVTTIGRRDGRRSMWGWMTALAATLFSAAVAIEVNGGPSMGAWTHAAFPVTTFLFMQHLAARRNSEQGMAGAEQPVADREQLIAEYEQMVAGLRQQVENVEQVMRDQQARHGRYTEDFEQQIRHYSQQEKRFEQKLTYTEQKLAEAEQAAAMAGGVDLLNIAQRLREHNDSWPAVAGLVGMAESTLRRQLAKRQMDEQAVKSNGHVVKGID